MGKATAMTWLQEGKATAVTWHLHEGAVAEGVNDSAPGG